jgi:hypothetical protein
LDEFWGVEVDIIEERRPQLVESRGIDPGHKLAVYKGIDSEREEGGWEGGYSQKGISFPVAESLPFMGWARGQHRRLTVLESGIFDCQGSTYGRDDKATYVLF